MNFDQWIVGEMDRGLSPDEVDGMRTAWICAESWGTKMSFEAWANKIVTIDESPSDETYRDLTNLERDQMRAAWDAALANKDSNL